MLLSRVHITHYKSITDSGAVDIDCDVTVLVGQNESGKTGFLQALHKARPLAGAGATAYNRTEEYPRRFLNKYKERHPEAEAVVATLTYALNDDEVAAISAEYGPNTLRGSTFEAMHAFEGHSTVTVPNMVDEGAYVEALVRTSVLDTDTKTAVATVKSLRDLVSALEARSLTDDGEKWKEGIAARVSAAKWVAVLAHEIWTKHLSPRLPRTLYFDDYSLLPGKVNLPELLGSVERELATPGSLSDQERTVLALLRMAGVQVADLSEPAGYESVKAKLEGFSNDITDQMFEFWTQNRELDVEFDLRADPQDRAPYNNGTNLYVRIKNRRHRVTVPFDQRSKGFIWFFSFLAWFKSVRESHARGGSAAGAGTLVLLLDEPGLSLHALAQQDLLRFIDSLTEEHQVIYSTHSPFMVQSARLHQVRVVEDAGDDGTKVSANLVGSSAKTRFPLQAALGYTVAQNLFISPRNLLVEGPADLIYLQHISAILTGAGRTGLRDDVTIVPVGGLDKVATFVALLGGNDLEFAVLHDSDGRPDRRLTEMAQAKMVHAKSLLQYGSFRPAAATPVASAPVLTKAKKGSATAVAATATPTIATPTGPAPGAAQAVPAGDVEDLFAPADFLALFNSAFAAELGGKTATVAALPPAARMIERLDLWLAAEAISLRPRGGFNHYRVASHLASHPPTSLAAETLDGFEAAFRAVNARFTPV